MVKIRTIQVRLSREQYDRILNDSIARGFSTLSAYFRYLALYRDQALTKKILEIHETVVPENAVKKSSRKGGNDEKLSRSL